MSLSIRPNTNRNNGLSPGIRDMEIDEGEDTVSVLMLVGLSDEQDSSCQTMRRTQVLTPAEGFPGVPESAGSETSGKLWYDPSCSTCCQTPSDSALSLLQLSTILITDDKVIAELRNSLSSGATESRQEEVLNLVFNYVQDNQDKTYVQKEDIVSLISRGPKKVKISKNTRLEFESKFKFEIPGKVKNLVAISFLSIDRDKVSQNYDIRMSFRESIQSLTDVVFIYNNGEKVLKKESRYLDVEKCFLKTSSNDVRTFLRESQKPRQDTIANRFWISRSTRKINTVFFGFDRREMIRSKCLLPFLRDSSVYDNVILGQISVQKQRFYNDKENSFLVSTREVSPGNILDVTNRDSFNGKNEIVASIEQTLVSTSRYKFFKVEDHTPSQERSRYLVTCTFRDPTIAYLERIVQDMGRLLRESNDYYDFVYQRDTTNPEAIQTFSSPEDSRGIASIAQLIDVYYREIVNFGGKRCSPKKYMIHLANPASPKERHSIFLKIVQTFFSTLKDFFTTFGVNSSGTGTISTNAYSNNQKPKGTIEARFTSRALTKPRTTGVDFVSSLRPDSAIVQKSDSITSKSNFTQEQISQRGIKELEKFWVATPTDPVLIEAAKFILTPNLFIDGDNLINLTSTGDYNDDFDKKVNAIPAALNGKLEPTLSGIIDVADSGILFEFEDDVREYADPSDYLLDNSNFISGDIKTYETSETVAAEQEIFKIFGVAAQSTFQQNFDSGQTISDADLSVRAVSTLPPPYQSYVLRGEGQSKFSGNTRFESLKSSENVSLVNNFMNTIAKLEYLDLASGLQGAEWKELTTKDINRLKNVLVRVNLFSDSELGIREKEGLEIYKQYFTISGDAEIPRLSSGNAVDELSDSLKEINNVIKETEDGILEARVRETFGESRD
tara:strand:+ start:11708 stop:14398 length:2691 start_codon:yes stop_codon:yes gene_type:complete